MHTYRRAHNSAHNTTESQTTQEAVQEVKNACQQEAHAADNLGDRRPKSVQQRPKILFRLRECFEFVFCPIDGSLALFDELAISY